MITLTKNKICPPFLFMSRLCHFSGQNVLNLKTKSMNPFRLFYYTFHKCFNEIIRVALLPMSIGKSATNNEPANVRPDKTASHLCRSHFCLYHINIFQTDWKIENRVKYTNKVKPQKIFNVQHIKNLSWNWSFWWHFLCKSTISDPVVNITLIDILSPSSIFWHPSIYLFAYKV